MSEIGELDGAELVLPLCDPHGASFDRAFPLGLIHLWMGPNAHRLSPFPTTAFSSARRTIGLVFTTRSASPIAKSSASMIPAASRDCW